MTEEQRAAAYRASMLARARYKAQQERALAGSRTAAREVRDAWHPMIDWLAERDDDAGQEPEDAGQIFNINRNA